jgi:hypothetical protein
MIEKRPRADKIKPGRPPSGRVPSKKDLFRLYIGEGKSIREVAEALKCSKDMVSRALKHYRIEARPNARRSQLRSIELEVLEDGIKEKGLRGFARELRIDKSTLLHHIRVRKQIK